MNKMLLTLAVLGLVLGMAGCGKGGDKPAAPPAAKPADKPADKAPPTPPPADPTPKTDEPAKKDEPKTTPPPVEEKKAPAPAPAAASTPKDAVKAWKAALESGDKAAFIAAMDTTPEQKGIFENLLVVSHEGILLEQAMKKAYGKDAKLADGPTKEWQFDSVDDDTCYTIEADKAVFKNKTGGKPINLVKVADVWKVKLDKVPTGPQAEMFNKMAPIMTKIFKDTAQKVGKEGYTADKINTELEGDMEKAMMSLMAPPTPPKVDVPKVDAPKVDVPKVDAPKVEVPKVEVPKVEIPKKEETK